MSAATPTPPVQPRRELGRWGLTAVGVNGIIGAGIYAFPAVVAAAIGGAGWIAYLGAAAATLLFGESMGRLGRHHDLTGGPYVYVDAAFGRFWGFQVGWFFFLARMTAIAALAGVFIQYLGAMWPVVAAGYGRAAAMTACVGLLAFINIVGIRQTAQAIDAFTIAKVAPLVLFILAGAVGADWSRAHPLPLPAAGPLGHTVMLLIYAFGGFEFLTVPAQEARRPREDVRFALLASIGLVSLVYIGVQVVATATTPGLAQSAAPLADAARRIVGRSGFAIMATAAVISTAGTILASLLVASRMIWAFARDGLAPAGLGVLHPRFRTPVAAVLVSTALSLALAISGTFVRMAALSAAARLVVYGACCAAALPLPEGSRILPAAGLAASLLLLGFLPRQDWLLAAGTIALGLVIYAGGGRRLWRRRLAV